MTLKQRAPAMIWSLLGVCLLLSGCGSEPGTAGDAGSQADSSNASTAADLSEQNQDALEPTIGEVVSDQFPEELAGSDGSSTAGGPTVSIRNGQDTTVTVTAVFSRGADLVHVSYIRIQPSTVATVVSPVAADRVEVSGTSVDGEAIESATLRFTSLTGSSQPLVFEIAFVHGSDGGSSGEDQGDGSTPAVPIIRLREPSSDLVGALGSHVHVRWEDESEIRDALVTLYLRPEGAVTDRSGWRQVGPAVAQLYDGINDELDFVVQGILPGMYEVVAEISGAGLASRSVAPGKIRVFSDPDNDAPKVSLTLPSTRVSLRNSDFLKIRWEDSDADDNANITLVLWAQLGSGQTLEYLLGPPIAEDPDGNGSDSVLVRVEGLLAGSYSLIATISDGQLVGSSRLESIVEVLPEEENTVPWVSVKAPVLPTQVELGSGLEIVWDDNDPDDNAILSLLLDPAVGEPGPDGDEILLVSSIAEDPDGPGNDAITLAIPEDMEVGEYWVLVSISDGQTSSFSVAPGLVNVVEPLEGQDNQKPSIDLVWPLTDQSIRKGFSFDFGAVFENIDPDEFRARYQIGAFLVNGDFRIDVMPASTERLNGTGREWTVDTFLLDIPNESPDRRFVILGELYDRGNLVDSDEAPGAIWVRQELQITDAHLEGIDCSSQQFDENAPRTGLWFTWFGGGIGNGIERHAPVDFWLVRDGIWPPPLNDPNNFDIVFSTVESPGVTLEEFVPWLEISHFDPGAYALVAVTYHPVYGELVAFFDGARIDFCRLGGIGGGPTP